jgi:hypothetical protein
MTVRRHLFFLRLPAWPRAVTLPAFAQAAPGASVPNFCGIRAYPYFPGFEPPAERPGPILNRSRIRGGASDGIADANQFVGDHSSPILQAGCRSRQEARRNLAQRRDLSDPKETSAGPQVSPRAGARPLAVVIAILHVGGRMEPDTRRRGDLRIVELANRS